jgi:hypothetical protein
VDLSDPLDDGVEAEAPGGDGEVDEARLDAGKPMVSSACSIGSWCDGKGRLETSRASVKLGRGRTRRFAAILTRRNT